MHARIGIDERQILALLGSEAGSAFARPCTAVPASPVDESSTTS